MLTKTRKHSSRIHTAGSPTICASVASHQMSTLGERGPQVNKVTRSTQAPDVTSKRYSSEQVLTVFSLGHQMSLAGGPQVNKFEQVSSFGHQMSIVKGVGQGQRGVPVQREDAACMVRSNATWVMIT